MKNYIMQGVVVAMLIIAITVLPFIVTETGAGFTLKLNKVGELFQSSIQQGLFEKVDAAFFERTVRTFFVLLISLCLGLAFALLLGLFAARFPLFRYMRSLINLLSVVPDFVIILFAIMLAVKIYEWTGIRVVTLTSDKATVDFWFPVLILSIAPAFYFLKLIHLRYIQISGEDYIRTAVAKGLKRSTIHMQYIYRNMQTYLNAELTKGLSLTVGNLFIVEYLLNIIGLTHYIFAVQDFSAMLLGLLALLVDALLVLGVVKLLLALFRKGFIYE
ncbi:ABC transporter permease subunit [Bacillus tianshenii]|nr:ABC transporter permease subunit [Bacillus tianshenii]